MLDFRLSGTKMTKISRKIHCSNCLRYLAIRFKAQFMFSVSGFRKTIVWKTVGRITDTVPISISRPRFVLFSFRHSCLFCRLYIRISKTMCLFFHFLLILSNQYRVFSMPPSITHTLKIRPYKPYIF